MSVKTISLFLVMVFSICSLSYAELTQYEGRKTVTNAGTAEALDSAALSFTDLEICAETDNTGIIVVGSSGVVAALATRKGVPLYAGDCYSIAPNSSRTGNLNTIYIDSTVSTDGVTYHGYLQR